MRSFSKKLAFVLAAAMVVTGFAPAAQAKAAEDFSLNRTSYILYTNEDSVNMKGSESLAEGLTGNVNSYDFNLANKPADWKTAYSYKWASSDAKIATVATGGVVTAKSVGKTVISCTITEKATGNVAATLKADVQVKANADDIEIYAADGNDYDGVKVAPGKYDFNRNMFDEAGNKTNKQGVYVTDYTKWVVEPANAGVTVDQSNGVVTVAEDANGEFTLYAYTYQSDKYTQATATSNKVVFTVGEANFDVKQDSKNQFTVKFDAPVKALATSDVTMIKRLALSTGNYDYPQAIKSVALAKDGMSATVTLFGSFSHNGKYIISVNGYEDYELTASLGVPTRIEISADKALGGEVLTTGTKTQIIVKFYDEKGVEVDPETYKNSFKIETRSNNYSVTSGGLLTIKKEGELATVIVESKVRENGKVIAELETKRTFTAIDAEPIVVSGLSGKTLTSTSESKPDWNKASMTMRLKNTDKKLWVKFATTDANNKDTIDLCYGSKFTVDGVEYKVSFTAMDPDIAVISTGSVITAFKTGTASFYVNLAEKTKNGYAEATPVAVVDVVVEANETFAYTTIDNNGSITLGLKDGFHAGTFKLSATDSYNQAWPITDGVTVKCVFDEFKEDAFKGIVDVPAEGGYAEGKAIIKVDAIKMNEVLAKNEIVLGAGEDIEVEFTATYKNYVTEFSVVIQNHDDDVENDIIIETVADNDALRINDDNKKATKKISFKVFEMNSGVKVDELTYTDASAVSSGSYYYKVTKDGKDVDTKFVDKKGNEVIVYLSDVDKDGNVIYDGVGAGTYEFVLFLCGDATVEDDYDVITSSEVDVYVGDKGAYYEDGDLLANKVKNADDDAEILACFDIRDRKGTKIADSKLYDHYVVSKNNPNNTGYVYVEKITFYESVGTNEFVPYVVELNTVLTVE